MLIEEGRKNEAVELFRNYAYPPINAWEVATFAEVSMQLDEYELGHQFLMAHANEFGYHEPIWIKYTQILAHKESWPELARIALSLRTTSKISKSLEGLTYYMEFLSAKGQNRMSVADNLAKKTASFDYEGWPEIGLFVAKELGQFGYQTEAISVLTSLESTALKDHNFFWETIFQLSMKVGFRDFLFRSAERLHQLNPDNPAYMNNYAAMLLSERRNPQEAIGLTWQLMNLTKEPTVESLINHALALLLNNRFDEAMNYLRKVPESRIPKEIIPGFNMAWFEMAYRIEDWPTARRYGLKIQPSDLLPGDKAWFEEAWEDLKSR